MYYINKTFKDFNNSLLPNEQNKKLNYLIFYLVKIIIIITMFHFLVIHLAN